MADEQNIKYQAQEALYKEIIANVKALEDHRSNSSAALKNLAEAWAWLSHPNQPH
ncbi:hypothetical protein [Streptomyces sp. NPDC057429]|uniref:hypothetical protein n=1 Tax=Streptomyces sp. NPDC057429 TaxID=3346130 RepID=UPI00369C27C9